ncbi:nucleotide-diphospho-sugar transferase [Tanacetum coccineum]|uniref:Nucleotide-diphospho-sugar transferase n=1 Tax=Tanacetum coccineum TaxID=301880 RepID=A0ABQ5GF58_9ASTR
MEGLDAMLENGPWFIRNNPLILKKWHPDENLLKEDDSTILVWVKLHGVLVTDFNEDVLSAIATKLGTPLMLDSYTSDMCIQSWGRSSYARVMIELRADVELKDNIVMAMPRIKGEGHYTCNVRVEYEWKPPRCSSCKIFGHIHEDCPKNTGAGEKKTMKKPSQTSRGVPKGMEPTIEVSNSNPFDVLNLVDNDVEFGTNGGTTNLVNNEATSSGSSFMNVDNDRKFASNTPIGFLTSDKDGSDKGYGTNSLLEQWRDSYPDNDDYDPYDDDMYENHDLSEHLQSICDDLDITVWYVIGVATLRALVRAGNKTSGDARLCMRTRSSSYLVGESSPNPTTSNPKRRNHRRLKQPFSLEESPVYTMADQRTMAELLRAPTEGYAEAIVVPPILVEHFELKHSLINMMTSDQFFGLEKDNPHDHIRWFNKITSTIKYKDVPNSAIKLMLFPFSLAGAARRWLKKEPPRSILTWEDLVSKFINEFFPPSRTTNL